MKKDSSDISIVLDRSGSMSSIATDTIGGFNTFLREQQSVKSDATITLAQFDNVYETVYRALDLQLAPLLTDKTFVPRGATALLDAIGRTIDETGARLAALSESERPEKVIFVILTDGEENSSSQFNAAQINAKITHQRDVYRWEFVFLGANQDAINTASQIGIGAGQALTYAADGEGASDAFESVSEKMRSYRSAAAPRMEFDADDRAKQKRGK